MKPNCLIIVFVMLFASLNAQNNDGKTKTSKAIAFAKTKPLSELTAVLSPDKAESIKPEKEVKNFLNIQKWENTDKSARPGQVQTKNGTKASRGPITGFSGQGGTGFVPPDTDGDVSNDHFVQMVNSKYNVYLKDGTKLLGPLDLSTLWAQLPGGPWGNSGDPIVLYDEEADRWILTQFAPKNNYSENYELFAVSETSDPTGAYYLYAFEFGTVFNDYPKMGVWYDGYYATYNMFQRVDNSFSFVGAALTVVEREKMLIGDPDAQMITTPGYSNGYIPGYYSTMPADIDGEDYPIEGSPCPIMYINNEQKIEIWNLLADWETPSNSTLIKQTPNITVSSFEETPSANDNDGFISQPNTDQKLDGLGRMIMNRLAYRKFADYETMVVNHSVLAQPEGGGPFDRSGIRWYELRKTDENWELYQEGTYAPDDGINRWMGSIAMNANGDIAIGYSVVNGEDIYPSIRYTGRRANDPLGEMTIEEIEVKSGTYGQNHYRWGDYSCMNVDPANDTSFWYTTEYNGWTTWIAEFDFSPITNATVEAGEDGYICINNQFQTNASGTSVLSIHWTTDGDGVFSPLNQFNTTYIRGNQDIANGGATLTITATGFDGIEVSDHLYLNIVPYINAGEDASIVDTEAFQLEAIGTETGSIQWSTSGDGSFSNENIMTPIYNPGSQDISNGQVTLSVVVEITEPCIDSKSDEMILSIATVGVNEINNNPKLSIYPNPTHDVFTLSLDDLDIDEAFTYKIYTSYGKEIYHEMAKAKTNLLTKTFDMSNFVAGIYFVSVQTEHGITTMKVLKN